MTFTLISNIFTMSNNNFLYIEYHIWFITAWLGPQSPFYDQVKTKLIFLNYK